MKPHTARPINCANHTLNCGFTLVEILVTITIIIVLAALSMIGVTHMRFAAAKADATNQIRQIGIILSPPTWLTDHQSC